MKNILILLAAALPLLASDASKANFSGRVFDGESNKQIANAIVTVNTREGYIASMVTNQAGAYSFASLPAGQYDFRVTAHGFAIYERKITISREAGVKELDIRMLVPANKQTVSVAELENRDITRVGLPTNETVRRGY